VGGCPKGNGTLGRAYSEQRARQRIFDHLHGSPAHNMEKAEAQEFADLACADAHTLVTEVVEEEPWDGHREPASKRQRGQYQKQLQQHQQNQGDVQSTLAVPVDLPSQLRQQTRNAFVFCKACVFVLG
jgi:hypothetical protein